MASDLDFVEYVCDQIASVGEISYRRMFGEYAVYCDGKVIGFVCDNQLFVKPTAAGRAFAADVAQGPPYPGAKPYLLIRDELDNREWMANLIRVTERELPLPKLRTPKTSKAAR